MNFQSSTQDCDEVIDTQLPSITPRKPSFLGAFLGRTGDVVAEDIRADAEMASYRMRLTEFSLTKIGALSLMEQQLSRVTPEAAERYQALVDACARQAVKQIERW